MTYLGEMISIGVAFSWTATALLSEFGSKRLGNLTLNVLRMALALLFSVVLFLAVLGTPWPGVTPAACGWMLLSGLVGYVIGDYCLFQCYIIIGSRYGQLFMTLAGISISVLGRGEHHKVSLKLPLNGVLFAIAAALCQGTGLVLSKIGMDHYEPGALPEWLLPFSANFLRCIAGMAGFTLLLYLRKGFRPLREAMGDRKGMAVATATTIFGPFVGVGFSLMAVQYTAAGIASTLMAMTPIIIILPSWWLFRQPITWKAVVGAVISVVGVSLFFLN